MHSGPLLNKLFIYLSCLQQVAYGAAMRAAAIKRAAARWEHEIFIRHSKKITQCGACGRVTPQSIASYRDQLRSDCAEALYQLQCAINTLGTTVDEREQLSGIKRKIHSLRRELDAIYEKLATSSSSAGA